LHRESAADFSRLERFDRCRGQGDLASHTEGKNPMGTKSIAKKTLAKTAAKKRPATKVKKKKGSHRKAAAKRLSEVSRRAVAEPSDDQASAEVGALHEHEEPRELSRERLRNPPEETAAPALDEDLVDDVAASADTLEEEDA
jgi:hypothetical protein